ncbi:PGF-pre-PGF domain-containing protein [Methanofollis formosanus]|nr:PGF-pre-PGF domain-containing protein [Methanofollis formosanus]
MKTGGIVETIPSGWTFTGTDHPEDRSKISGSNIVFSVINDAEIVYHVRIGPRSGVITGEWDDVLNCTNGTVPETSIMIAGSDGGGTSTWETYENRIENTSDNILLFSKDETKGHPFTHNDGVVTGIRLSGNRTLEDVNLSVRKISQPSDLPSPEGVPYTYLNITPSGHDTGNITRAAITFEVNVSWMDQNWIEPSSIVLMRYNSTWTALPTNRSGKHGINPVYTAVSPGFSTFAITGTAIERGATTTSAAVEKDEAKKPVTIATPKQQSRPDLKTANTDKNSSGLLVPGLLTLLVICGVVGYLLYRRREDRPEEKKE